MANEAILNLEELLAPIPGEQASGANLMYAGLHDEIRDARRADDALAQGEWKRDPKTSDWRLVTRLATEALQKKTKDLQVAAWLTEALLNLHGFAGLRDGLQLIRGLLDRYWDNLYPEIDDGDLEARANAIDLLNRPFLLAALQKVPITDNPVGSNYSYLNHKDSSKFDIPDNLENLPYEDLERFTALRQLAETEGKITSDQWRIAKSASNRRFYEDLHSLLASCRNECQALDALMDDKFQRQSPGLSDCKKALADVSSLVETIVKEKRILEPDAPAPVEVSELQSAAAGSQAPIEAVRASGVVKSRQDALRRLGELAEFFRSTEPHSPVSYLLQRAIRWGESPLESWLDDVVKDPNVLAQIRDTLGLKPPDEG